MSSFRMRMRPESLDASAEEKRYNIRSVRLSTARLRRITRKIRWRWWDWVGRTMLHPNDPDFPAWRSQTLRVSGFDIILLIALHDETFFLLGAEGHQSIVT
ncbi:hypothetical protein BDN71DRAFT_283547 [Pleurotus eryngii]|uniref:Uncharacterized protein n=1 Tax=Pleurotus eryngii TaxID=5323 RepID=A0A9P6D3J6_PLEER|nr:hypothetical protein BDN71DRAFT_283547 [Pleurotus eryngii]